MEGFQAWNPYATEEAEYNTELVVYNFHPLLSKEALKNQFKRFGHVESANVTTNTRGNPMGFVTMGSVSECNRAIAALNGRAPLHWKVEMGNSPAERQRRRREREEARRFEMEMAPKTAAYLQKMREDEARMLKLTRDFCSTLQDDTGFPDAEDGEREAADPEHTPASNGGGGGGDGWGGPDGKLRPCSVCGALTPGYCPNCSVPYCSAQCQHADWDTHKHQCGRQQSLTVSVSSGDEEQTVRSVSLGRPANHPRSAATVLSSVTVPAPEPTPLRRPRAGQTNIGGAGDGPAPTTPPRQQQQYQEQQRSPSMQQPPSVQQSPSPQQQPTQQSRRQQQLELLRKRQQQKQQQQQQQKLGPVILQRGQHYPVMVCYAADPSAVYLRLADQYGLVQEMETELSQRVVPPAAPAGTRGLEPGQLCAALFEGTWYRGEVRSASSDHYLVHFIDWGNSERVSPTAVAPLPSGLDAAPPQAVLAALPWRPAGADGAWSDAQWVGLRALDGVPLTASLVGTEPAVSVALFNADGKSVLSVMGDGGRTGQPAVSQGDGEDGEMVLPPQPELDADRKHVVSPCALLHPQLVCGQLKDPALYRPYRALHDTLQTAAIAAAPLSSVPPQGRAVLVRCAGPLGGAPAWHRAAVEGRHGDQAVLRLLDWGTLKTAGVELLRRMPNHLSQTPAVGVRFGLYGISDGACDEEQLRFFREKLIGQEFLLERVECADAQVQARLHLLSDTNSFCFNDKMLGRIADSARVGRSALPSALSPSSDSPQKRSRLISDSSSTERPLSLTDLACSTLRPGDTHVFLLGQVLCVGRFFASPLTVENTAAVERVETEMREAMSARPPPPVCRQPLHAGQLVAVQDQVQPEVWSRGAVVDPVGPQMLVRLLDVGRQERVPPERLRQMPPQVSRLAPGSLLLAFRGSDRWTAEQQRRAEAVLRGDGDETVLEMTVLASSAAAGAAMLVSCQEVDFS